MGRIFLAIEDFNHAESLAGLLAGGDWTFSAKATTAFIEIREHLEQIWRSLPEGGGEVASEFPDALLETIARAKHDLQLRAPVPEDSVLPENRLAVLMLKEFCAYCQIALVEHESAPPERVQQEILNLIDDFSTILDTAFSARASDVKSLLHSLSAYYPWANKLSSEAEILMPDEKSEQNAADFLGLSGGVNWDQVFGGASSQSLEDQLDSVPDASGLLGGADVGGDAASSQGLVPDDFDSFDAIGSELPQDVPMQRGEYIDTSDDFEPIRNLYFDLARHHCEPLAGLISQVERGDCGEDTFDALSGIFTNLYSSACSVEYNQLADALNPLLVQLDRMIKDHSQLWGRIEEQKELLRLYNEIAPQFGEIFKPLDPEATAKLESESTLILDELRSLGGMGRQRTKNLFSAGISRLAILCKAHMSDLQAVSGITDELAQNLSTAFQIYQPLIDNNPRKLHLLRQKTLRDLTFRVMDFEQVLGEISDHVSKNKFRIVGGDEDRDLVRRRNQIYLSIRKCLAILGRPDQIERLAEMEFEKRVEHLWGFLEELESELSTENLPDATPPDDISPFANKVYDAAKAIEALSEEQEQAMLDGDAPLDESDKFLSSDPYELGDGDEDEYEEEESAKNPMFGVLPVKLEPKKNPDKTQPFNINEEETVRFDLRKTQRLQEEGDQT